MKYGGGGLDPMRFRGVTGGFPVPAQIKRRRNSELEPSASSEKNEVKCPSRHILFISINAEIRKRKAAVEMSNMTRELKRYESISI